MANRKTKLDYIQLPSDHLVQRDVRKLLRLYNAKHPGLAAVAYSVLTCLYTTMARDSAGYYLEYDEDLVADLANELYLDEELVQDSIAAAVEAGILDRRLLDDRLLSSFEYQSMYFTVISKLGRVIDLTSMPYILIDTSEYSQGREVSHRESFDNPKGRTDSSRVSPNLAAESLDSSIECADSLMECANSSQDSTDSLRNCRRKVRYGKSIEEGDSICVRARKELPPFGFPELDRVFSQLMEQPLWRVKTFDAIRIAHQKLKAIDPFLAVEMVRHTIMANIRDIDDPTPAMIAAAENNKKYISKKSCKITVSKPSFPQKFKQMTEPGEMVSEDAHKIRNMFSTIMKRADRTTRDQLIETNYVLGENNQLTILTSEEAIKWLKADGMPEFANHTIVFSRDEKN